MTHHDHASIHDLFTHNRAWAAQMERERPGFFTSLVKQQTPKYMWIGCSDSRVPANQITGLEPGEVFVHRNVANVVVHSDLNALSAIQFAVEHAQGRAHHGGRPLRLRRRAWRRWTARASAWPTTGSATSRTCATATARCSDSAAREQRADALCDLNVIEQVVNVCVSTVMVDAWAAARRSRVHGWAFGVHDGLLQDLQMTVSSTDSIEPLYRAAVEGVVAARG